MNVPKPYGKVPGYNSMIGMRPRVQVQEASHRTLLKHARLTGFACAPQRVTDHLVQDNRSRPCTRSAHAAAAVRHVLLINLLLISVSTAQEVQNGRSPHWRQAFVPMSNPQAWPAGDWIPLLTEDYRELLAKSLMAATPSEGTPPWIETVEYSARLVDGVLDEGRLTAQIVNPSGTSQVVNLGRPSLALDELMWVETGSGVVWGTDVNGVPLLVARSKGGTLTGEWSARGDHLLDDLVFDLRLLPGVMSLLRIDLPVDLVLTATEGVVVPPGPGASQSSFATWLINLGHHQQSRLVISPRQTTAGSSIVLYESTSAYSLTSDGVEVQSEFHILSPLRGVPSMEFDVPMGLRVESITLRGEARLPHQHVRRNRIRVSTSGLDGERRTVVRIRGDLRRQALVEWSVPKLLLRDGVALSSVIRLNVARPLELKTVTHPGYRIVSMTSDESAGDSLECDEFDQDASLQITVDRPDTSFSAQTLTHVRWDVLDPELTSIVSLAVTSGAADTVRCLLPSDWQVLGVEPIDATVRSGIARWSTGPGPEGQTELVVELLDAVTSRQEVHLRVMGRHVDGHLKSSRTVPMFDVVGALQQEAYLGIHPPIDEAVTLPAESSLQQIDVNQLPAAWDEFIRWSDHDIAASDRMLFYCSRDPGAARDAVLVSSGRSDRNSLLAATSGSQYDALTPGSQMRSPNGETTTDEPSPTTHIENIGVPLGELSGLTLMPAMPGGAVVNHVTLRLSPQSAGTEVPVSLPDEARLINVRVDGRELDAVIQGQSIAIMLPDDQSSHDVELEYESSAGSGWMSRLCEVPVPTWGGRNTEVNWTVQLPAGDSLLSTSAAFVSGSRTDLSRIDRLLGPLGSALADTSAGSNSAKRDDRTGNQTDRESRKAPLEMSHRYLLSLPFNSRAVTLRVWHRPMTRRLAWVSLMLGLVLAVGCRRLQSDSWIRRMVAVTLALAVSSLVVPAPVAPIVGGVVLGLWIGSLLPEWLITASQHREPSSSGEFVRSSHVLRTVPVVLCLVTLLDARAADEPTADVHHEASRIQFDAVIPVASDTGDASAPRIVYVDDSSLERLRSASASRSTLPRYLIRSAEYEVLQRDEALGLRLRYEVVHQHTGIGLHRVFLPIRNVVIPHADETCRVGDRLARIIPVTDGSGLIVEWEATASESPRSATSDSGQSVGEGDADVTESGFQSSRIEIECLVRSTSDSARVSRVSIPQVASSRVTLPPGSPFSIVNRGFSATRRSGSDEKHIRLGPESEIIVMQAGPDGVEQVPRWEVSNAAAQVTLHPRHIDLIVRLTMVTPSATDALTHHRTLTMRLPPRSIMKRVAVPQMVATSTRMTKDDEVIVSVAFEHSGGDALLLELDFMAPVSSRDGEVRVPELDLIPQEASQSTCALRAGFTPSPGFRIAPFADNVADERVRTLSPESFVQQWPGMDLVTTPSLAYELAAPTGLRFRESSIRPFRVAEITQSLFVHPTAVNWEADVLLDVDFVPTALHEFALDSRIALETVSVQQDGAERIVHWSHTEDGRLVLFLSDELTGAQAIRMKGRWELRDRDEVAIPELSVADGRVQSSHLRILNQSGGQIELSSRDSDREGARPSGEIAVGGVTSVDLRQTDPPTLLRLKRGADAFVADQVTLVRSDGKNGVEVRSNIRIRAIHGRMQDVILLVPKEFVTTGRMLITPAPVSMEDPGEGHQQVLLRPADGEDEMFIVVSTILDRRPDSARWSLPGIDVTSARGEDHYLVVSDELRLAPKDAQSRMIPVDSLPLWMSARLAEASPGGWRCYQGVSSSWLLVDEDRESARVSVRLAESDVWSEPDGRQSGVTTFWVEAQSRTNLLIHFASGQSLQHLRLDGRPVGDSRKLDAAEVVLDGGPGLHELQIWWIVDSAQKGLTREIALPQLSGVPVQEHLMTLSIPDNELVWGMNAIRRLTPSEYDRIVTGQLHTLPVLSGGPPAEQASSASGIASQQGSGPLEREPSALHSDLVHGELISGSGLVRFQTIRRTHVALIALVMGFGVLLVLFSAPSVRSWIQQFLQVMVDRPAVAVAGLGTLLLAGGHPLLTALVVSLALAFWGYERLHLAQGRT